MPSYYKGTNERGTAKWFCPNVRTGNLIETDSLDEAAFVDRINTWSTLPEEWFGIAGMEITGLYREPMAFGVLEEMHYNNHRYPKADYYIDFLVQTDKGNVWVEIKGFNKYRNDQDERYKEHIFIRSQVLPDNDNNHYIKLRYKNGEFVDANKVREEMMAKRKASRKSVTTLWRNLQLMLAGKKHEPLDGFEDDLEPTKGFRGADKWKKYGMFKHRELITKAIVGDADALARLPALLDETLLKTQMEEEARKRRERSERE